MARARKKASKKVRPPRARKAAPKKLSGKKAVPASKKTVITKRAVSRKRSARAVARIRSKKTRPAPSFFLSPGLPSAYEAVPDKTHILKPALEIDRRLPTGYGDDKLVLMVRDPWWLFSYWEISARRADEIAASLPHSLRDSRVTVLRVYDLTETSFDRPNSFFDIELRWPADCWYIDAGTPDRSWGAEIGFRLADGRFWPMVRSNIVRTPRFGFSDVLDEEWMIPDEDFWRLAGSFGSQGLAGSPSEGRSRGDWFLRSVSSDGASQFSVKPSRPAGSR